MSKEVEKILEAALAIPSDQRAELVASILASIDEDPAVKAHVAESMARLAAFLRGELATLNSVA